MLANIFLLLALPDNTAMCIQNDIIEIYIRNRGGFSICALFKNRDHPKQWEYQKELHGNLFAVAYLLTKYLNEK